MEHYSLSRRMWRVIYPTLIYVAVLLVAVVWASFAAGLYMGVREAVNGINKIDAKQTANEIEQILLDDSMHIQFYANYTGFTVFLPMWLKLRRRYELGRDIPISIIGIMIAGIFAIFCMRFVRTISITEINRVYESISTFLSNWMA